MAIDFYDFKREGGFVRPQPPRKRKKRWIYFFITLSAAFSCYQILSKDTSDSPPPPDKSPLPSRFDFYSSFKNFPRSDTFSYRGSDFEVRYSADSLLQKRVQIYLERYLPEAAVYLVGDLKSGKVLALGERRDSAIFAVPGLAFGKKFPAASLVKIITALTAMQAGITPVDSILQKGRHHTLYKSQLTPIPNDWSEWVPLRTAFARSFNPAFGMLGVYLRSESLMEQAKKLGFNRSDWAEPISPSLYALPDTTEYALAELSCGFTKTATLSPIHALELARAIATDGKISPVHFSTQVKSLRTQEKWIESSAAYGAIESQYVGPMRVLMEATITEGTSRKAFRKTLKKNQMEDLVLGGKTGSLDGDDPKGRYDWFLGYAMDKHKPGEGIAILVLQIHQTYHSLPSAQVAALIIRDWVRG